MTNLLSNAERDELNISESEILIILYHHMKNSRILQKVRLQSWKAMYVSKKEGGKL